MRVAGVLGRKWLQLTHRLWAIQQNVDRDISIGWWKGRLRVESTRAHVRRVKCGLVAGSFPRKVAYLCLSHTSGVMLLSPVTGGFNLVGRVLQAE